MVIFINQEIQASLVRIMVITLFTKLLAPQIFAHYTQFISQKEIRLIPQATKRGTP